MRPSRGAARGSGRIVGPQHRVDVITGLKARTIWPAYQIFEEETKGRLEVGKLADFAILSKDPTAVTPTTIADIQVAETIKEGATVFRLAPPTGGKTASDRTSERFARMLRAMAHPAPTAGKALLPGSAQLRARMMANMPPGGRQPVSSGRHHVAGRCDGAFGLWGSPEGFAFRRAHAAQAGRKPAPMPVPDRLMVTMTAQTCEAAARALPINSAEGQRVIERERSGDFQGPSRSASS